MAEVVNGEIYDLVITRALMDPIMQPIYGNVPKSTSAVVLVAQDSKVAHKPS